MITVQSKKPKTTCAEGRVESTVRSQAKGQQARVRVQQAGFAKGIKDRQWSPGRQVRGGIRSKTETYSFSQETQRAAKNNWMYFHIWLLGGANHQEPHKPLLSWEGSLGSAPLEPCWSLQQSLAVLPLGRTALGLHADGLQRDFSHFGEYWSQIKHISTRAWRKHFSLSTTQGVFPHMVFPAACFICCYFLFELYKSNSF